MKNIKIYFKDINIIAKNNEILICSLDVDDYTIDTYVDTFEIECNIQGINFNFCIPQNKGYKIIIEV